MRYLILIYALAFSLRAMAEGSAPRPGFRAATTTSSSDYGSKSIDDAWASSKKNGAGLDLSQSEINAALNGTASTTSDTSSDSSTATTSSGTRTDSSSTPTTSTTAQTSPTPAPTPNSNSTSSSQGSLDTQRTLVIQRWAAAPGNTTLGERADACILRCHGMQADCLNACVEAAAYDWDPFTFAPRGGASANDSIATQEIYQILLKQAAAQ